MGRKLGLQLNILNLVVRTRDDLGTCHVDAYYLVYKNAKY